MLQFSMPYHYEYYSTSDYDKTQCYEFGSGKICPWKKYTSLVQQEWASKALRDQ